jgi:thiol-disulfide isomerase/thioredoxin
MKRRIFLQSGFATALFARPAAARAPFIMGQDPTPILSPPFQDTTGRALSLADFSGKVVLLNIWATWCPPCRTEMPALDALQGHFGSADLTVLALSIDGAGIGAAKTFYQDIGIRNLGLYWGEDLRVQLALGFRGLPTSLLINREGAEIARLNGPAKWDSKSSVRQLLRVIKGG